MMNHPNNYICCLLRIFEIAILSPSDSQKIKAEMKFAKNIANNALIKEISDALIIG